MGSHKRVPSRESSSSSSSSASSSSATSGDVASSHRITPAWTIVNRTPAILAPPLRDGCRIDRRRNGFAANVGRAVVETVAVEGGEDFVVELPGRAGDDRIPIDIFVPVVPRVPVEEAVVGVPDGGTCAVRQALCHDGVCKRQEEGEEGKGR